MSVDEPAAQAKEDETDETTNGEAAKPDTESRPDDAPGEQAPQEGAEPPADTTAAVTTEDDGAPKSEGDTHSVN